MASSQETLKEIVAKFHGLRIAVVGDLMMDEYVWGSASRVSPESPVLVIDVDRETEVPGGAANVAANVTALGAQSRVFGAVGDDEVGSRLCNALETRGSDVSGIVVDPSRPTTRKTRVVAQNQQVLRIDREKTHSMCDKPATELSLRVLSALNDIDAVLVSDYAKGVVTGETAPAIISACRVKDIIFAANGKPDNVQYLRGSTLLSLNQSEAISVSGDKNFSADDISQQGAALRSKLDVQTLVVTRGGKGLSVWSENGDSANVPAHRVEVYDVAGAGDTAITTLTMALAVGARLEDAARLAVTASAIVVGKVGVATVSAEELMSHL